VRCLHDFAFSPPLCLILLQLQWNTSADQLLESPDCGTVLRMCTSYGTSLEEVVCAVWSPLGAASTIDHVHVDTITKKIFSDLSLRLGPGNEKRLTKLGSRSHGSTLPHSQAINLLLYANQGTGNKA
jgi:hypothetical protein